MASCIVSIDGGGIKGYLPALVLAGIESQAGKKVGDMAGVLVGTSTGAILALGLAAGISASDMAEFYRLKGPAIFRKPLGKRLTSLFGLADEQYGNEGLRRGLDEIFGDRMFSQLGPCCMVCAYDIEARKTRFFASWEAERDSSRDYRLVDLAMASSAAPTYFEPVEIVSASGDRMSCIDGGVAANNPALAALIEAKKAGWNLDGTRLVSLGTGREDRPYLATKARGWGLAKWARPLLDVLFSAASEVTDHQCRALLGDRYARLQQDFTEPVGMDDTSARAFTVMRMCAGKILERPEATHALRLLEGE